MGQKYVENNDDFEWSNRDAWRGDQHPLQDFLSQSFDLNDSWSDWSEQVGPEYLMFKDFLDALDEDDTIE